MPLSSFIALAGGLLGAGGAVLGGQVSAPCAWPTVAYAEGCTGTLVHPELLVLAAHCPPPEVVKLADHLKAQPPGAHYVPTRRCEAHPGHAAGLPGHDVAYCVLEQPVDFIPIVPVAAGCERDAARVGATVAVVGFGEDERGDVGPKREVRMSIKEIADGELFIGGDGRDTCRGDSGGPVFVAIADGVFRQIAITSRGDGCGEGGFYTDLGPHIAWLEERSGLDITPCHDPDGTWNPGAACDDLAISPGVGAGTGAAADPAWADRCAGVARTAAGATCGPPRVPPASAGCRIAASAPPPTPWMLAVLYVLGRRGRRRRA